VECHRILTVRSRGLSRVCSSRSKQRIGSIGTGFLGRFERSRAGQLLRHVRQWFGTKAHSADALLHVYAIKLDFKAWNGRK
jgi:hypothetical protein